MGEIEELINRRRRQVYIHSCIYYRLNTNIIPDHKYDLWSKELAELQDKHPEIAQRCVYAEEFEGFDGSSGFDLPTHEPEIIVKAQYLLNSHKKYKKRRPPFD